MTEFAIPVSQVQFYTWPIGDSDETVRLDLYEPPWERADIDSLKRTQCSTRAARALLVESLREGRPEGTPFLGFSVSLLVRKSQLLTI